MCSKRVVRCWRQCANWSAKSVSWCSACAGVIVFIIASQSSGCCRDDCKVMKTQMSHRLIGSRQATHGLGVEGQRLLWHHHPTTQEARHMEKEVGAVSIDMLPCP